MILTEEYVEEVRQRGQDWTSCREFIRESTHPDPRRENEFRRVGLWLIQKMQYFDTPCDAMQDVFMRGWRASHEQLGAAMIELLDFWNETLETMWAFSGVWRLEETALDGGSLPEWPMFWHKDHVGARLRQAAIPMLQTHARGIGSSNLLPESVFDSISAELECATHELVGSLLRYGVEYTGLELPNGRQLRVDPVRICFAQFR